MSQASITQAPHRSLRASLLLSASLLASALVACGSSGRDDRSAGTWPLPIGAAIALTGNASVIGQDQRIGLEIARDYFQGNFQAKGPALDLKIQDGGSDEATATNAFRSLIGANVVALIGPSLSQQAFAVDPIADRAGIPVVGPSNTASGIPRIGAFVSRVSAPVAKVAPLSIAAALRLNPKIRSAAVFYAQDEAYSTSESQIFQQALVDRNLKPVAVIRTSVSDTDFQSQITETLRRKSDLIVISGLPSDGGNLVRQLPELGFKGSLVAGNGMNSPNIYSICQRFCDGLLIAQAYTAYQVIAESLSSLQVSLPPGATLASLPRAELRRRPNTALLKGRYQTPLGEIRFTPEGEVIQNQFYVAQVRMNRASGWPRSWWPS